LPADISNIDDVEYPWLDDTLNSDKEEDPVSSRHDDISQELNVLNNTDTEYPLSSILDNTTQEFDCHINLETSSPQNGPYNALNGDENEGLISHGFDNTSQDVDKERPLPPSNMDPLQWSTWNSVVSSLKGPLLIPSVPGETSIPLVPLVPLVKREPSSGSKRKTPIPRSNMPGEVFIYIYVYIYMYTFT
jgi:hypothetical protein